MKNALLLLVILAASVSPVAAQSSADGLDSTLVAYYRWCNRHKQDPEMLLKADTMFRLAGEKQNRRMQAVALCLKTDYYYYTNKFDSVKVWVARTQQFTRQHNQPTHYYFVWTRLISYYTKYSKYTLAQYELDPGARSPLTIPAEWRKCAPNRALRPKKRRPLLLFAEKVVYLRY